jgi:glycosyltransferase involved in cell wall biosynthesis
MIEVSVVSGTFNRLVMLQKMVYSVRQSTAGLSYEIVLCDGGSTDGTLAWIKQQPDIRLIEHGELRGAIAAFNDAARICSRPLCSAG